MSKISQEKIDHFLENGYLILPGLFNPQEIDILLNNANSLESEAKGLLKNLPDNEIHKVMHKGSQFVIQNLDESAKIHRIVWAGAAAPNFLSLSKQNKLLEPVSQLLESPKANYIINSLHLKLSNDGVEFAPHQDIHHRRNYDPNWENINGDRSYIVCITAIDPMTENNGPIMMISGSHKQGEVPRDQLKKRFDFGKAIPLLLEAGDTGCMHQYLVHWSLPNESSGARFTLINGFSYLGANHVIYPGEGSSKLIDLVPFIGVDEL